MSQFHYDTLIEEQLLQVVRQVLKQAKLEGIEDPHCFYITFLTNYPGVEIPPYLHDEYPEEITIVLQYQFWELTIEKNYFSVVLSFNENDEKVRVPFKSIVNFSDPSANFNLDFQPQMPEKAALQSFADPGSKKEKLTDNGENVISLDRFRRK